jgi:quercetin dioxygenase-like cupin family protein
MSYDHVVVDDLDPTPGRPCLKRAIGDATDLERVAVNRYEAEPGEQVPLAYHYHDTQEEVFYVLAGTLAVETPERTYEVPADDAFVAQPGSPHRAYNPESATDPVVVLAVGAPTGDDTTVYDPNAEA